MLSPAALRYAASLWPLPGGSHCHLLKWPRTPEPLHSLDLQECTAGQEQDQTPTFIFHSDRHDFSLFFYQRLSKKTLIRQRETSRGEFQIIQIIFPGFSWLDEEVKKGLSVYIHCSHLGAIACHLRGQCIRRAEPTPGDKGRKG